MADQQLRFTLDFLAKTAGLKNANELLDQLGSELDDSVDTGKQFAATMRQVADKVERDLQETEQAAKALADALGPELSAALGQSKVENYAVQFRRAGLSIDDVTANIDDLADSVRRLEGIDAPVRDIGAAVDDVGRKTERTGSVVANFAGNAAQELPGVGAAFGPLNMAIGQFVEYASEGDISFSKFLKAAGGLAALTVGIQLLSSAFEASAKQQELLKQRTDEVVPAIETQIRKAYELATANDAVASSTAGFTAGQDALTQALLNTGESGEKLRDALGSLGVDSDYLLQSMAQFAGEPVGALKQLALAAGASEEVAQLLAEAVNKTDTSLADLDTENTMRSFLGLEDSTRALVEELLAAGRASGLTDQQILDIAGSLEAVQDEVENTDLDAITQQFLNNQYASSDAARSLIDLAEANLKVGRADEPLKVYAEYNRLLGDADAATRDAILGTSEYADEQAELAAAYKRTSDRILRQIELTDELYGIQRSAIERQRDYAQAQQETADVLADAEASTSDQLDAIINLSEEYATLEGASLDSAAGTGRQIDSLRTMLATIDPASPLYKALAEYLGLLDSIPETVNTQLGLSTPSGAAYKLGFGTGEPGRETVQVGNGAPGTVNLTVYVTNPVMSGQQIAEELAAYYRRSGATFKLFG